MKKYITLLMLSFISVLVFSQTPSHSFEYHPLVTNQELTQSQIETYITKANFETYRLQDQRRTLSFDNGFEIVLLSANEAARLGLINTPASYPTSEESKNKLPVFHMATSGSITAAYTADGKNYKRK